jgi:hypothetical protein
LAVAKFLLGWVAGAAGSAALAGGALALDPQELLHEGHAWARFGKGAWREVRIVTQSFDEGGQPTDSSITDNKTTVEEVTPDRVTLKVEVTVEVAGQRFPSAPQIIKQGYAGETVGQTVSFKPGSPETVTIDGEEVRCETRQIEILGGVTREVNLISYAPDHVPAILRRRSTMSDAAGTKTMQESTSEVKAVNMARRILGERDPKPAYLVKVEQHNDRGTTTTWSWHVPDVPGEIVDQSSKKLDNEGRLVRRTTLELVGYGGGEVSEHDFFSEPENRRQRRRKRR